MMKLISPLDNERRTAIFEWLLLIFLVLGYFAWLSTNTVYSASANGRLLEVFEGDEFDHFFIIRQALSDHTACVEWNAYGHFHFNLVLFPLLVLQHFSPVSDQVIILALRYVATLSSALTVILTFGLARRYFSRPVAWLSSLLLAVLPSTFNYWSVTSHPDTLQMLTVVACVFACCEFVYSERKGWLIVAAACAGLAFSTKYVGVFLLPIIWLLCLIPFKELRNGMNSHFLRPPRLRPSIRLVVFTGLAFWAGFVLASPCLLLDGQFVNGIIMQARYVTLGSGNYARQTDNNHMQWFTILSSSSLLGVLNTMLLALALIAFLVRAWRTEGKEFFSHEGLLWIWVLFYFTYAFFMVNVRVDRYLLVIMPFIFILLPRFFTDALDYLRSKLAGNFTYYFVVGIIIAALGLEVGGGFTRQLDLITERMTREKDNRVIEVGLWLEANYPPSTRIIYDKYSYVPPTFTRVFASYGMRESLLETFHPRVIVINDSIRDGFSDAALAPFFSGGEELFMEIHDFYLLMEQEKLGYKLIRDFGGIRVYEKER